MKTVLGTTRLSATDLSNHLHCTHLTAVNQKESRGEIIAPDFRAPHLVILQARGLDHEQAYLRQLSTHGLTITDLTSLQSDSAALQQTHDAMQNAADVIVQPALADGLWFGRPDILRKVPTPSRLGNWSYEPYDCKLAKQTKAATLLQLSHYASLLETAQGTLPAHVYVVPPVEDFTPETYRTLDYAAYYRSVRARLQQALQHPSGDTYPEPTAHCDVCRWWPDCDRQRRRDDHLSLTAGITRLQRKQLAEWDTHTMASLARLPLPLPQRPRHGTRPGYERVREQARLQVTARLEHRPLHELLPFEPNRGLARLPEPSAGDLFFDLESDPYVGQHGLEYLFGVSTQDEYLHRWAHSAAEEKAAFEWFVDYALERRERFPNLHIYHYGHKEPSTLKALMGRYATREDAIDRLLRGGVLIDLHSLTKQALRASVETYSLKALEEFHAFRRAIPLHQAQTAMRQLEHHLELARPDQIDPGSRDAVQAYNADDCYSTKSLRDWLETLRATQIAHGNTIERPALTPDTPSGQVAAQQARIEELVQKLTCDIPDAAESRTEHQAACWLLANLLDWHRRENKVAFWEKFRLEDLDDEQLLDERKAIAELQYVRTIPPAGQKKLPTVEYRFPPQEVNLEEDKALYHAGQKIGTIDYIQAAHGLVGIRRTAKAAAEHPRSVYSYEIIDSTALSDSLFRFATWVSIHGFDHPGAYGATYDLLLRHPPRRPAPRPAPEAPLVREGESTLDAARRLALQLNHSVLPIQGPPGSGKTFTGARMIVELIRQGKRVGVAAGSHKVIRKLLEDTADAAIKADLTVFTALHKVSKKSDDGLPAWLTETTKNEEARDALERRTHAVVAGTAWLWASADFAACVDVLFVDEAGQMSLANALAIAPAAQSLVLLGDPQQLDQPLKGSHPDGAEVSALEHLLQGAKTIPAHAGLFLAETRRLHPDLCRFTSEAFYENRLTSYDGLEHQRVEGHPWLGVAGLRYVPVSHTGNQNCSLEEVDRIVQLVGELLHPGIAYVNHLCERRPLAPEDILIVAPYNAQVAALAARLPDLRIGTVDKFQGQEAPIVIYSLTTSSPEDAPRGMEFLYSLNRLNVATSRARALVILVANPHLLEPNCQNPRQMQLASALCRYIELAPTPQLTRTAGDWPLLGRDQHRDRVKSSFGLRG